MRKFSGTTAMMMLLTTLFVLSVSASARADEAAPTSAFGQMVNRLNPANWKMPSLQRMMPQSQEKARIKKKKDSLVDEVGKTASNSWNRTKQTLNPANFFPASSRTPAKSTPAAKKPGFFQSLFSPSVPKDEHATMSGFLKQDRPTP